MSTRAHHPVRLPMLLLAALVALPAGAAAGAGTRYKVDTHGFGTFTTTDAGSVSLSGTASGAPFDGTYQATLAAEDGSLPDPGTCEPATATLRIEGWRDRYLELRTTGKVCGQWLQPPTSVVTQVFTGRYVVTASSKRNLVGTDGFHEIRLGNEGQAGTFAIDT